MDSYKRQVKRLEAAASGAALASSPVGTIDATASAWVNALANSSLRCIDKATGLQALRLCDAEGNQLPALFRNEASSTVFVRKEDVEILGRRAVHMCITPVRTGKGQPMLVTGNPGIGKSRNAEYLLHKLLQLNDDKRPPAIVWFFEKVSHVFVFTKNVHTGQFEAQSFPDCATVLHAPRDVRALLRDHRVVYLHDAGDHPHLQVTTATMVVFVSSQLSKYKEWMKQGVVKLFKNPWTEAEIVAGGRELGIDEATVLARFERYGGIPRYVFGREEDRAYADDVLGIDLNAWNGVNLASIAAMASARSLDASVSSPSSMFAISRAGEGAQVAQFVSRYAAARTIEAVGERANAVMDALGAGGRGSLFEAAAVYRVALGGEFRVRRADSTEARVISLTLRYGGELVARVDSLGDTHERSENAHKRAYEVWRSLPVLEVTATSPASDSNVKRTRGVRAHDVWHIDKVVRAPTNFHLVDFMLARDVVVNAKNQKDKTVAYEPDLLRHAVAEAQLDAERPLRLFTFVPRDRFSTVSVRVAGNEQVDDIELWVMTYG